MLSKLRSSITAKMTLLVLLGATTVLVFVLAYSGIYSRQIIRKDAEENALKLAAVTAEQLDSELEGIAVIAKNLAYAAQYGAWNEETITALLHKVVQDNNDVFGSTIAFEPHAFSRDLRAYAPYFYKGSKGLNYVQLGTDSYNYFVKDWYRKPLLAKTPMWSAPYFDKGGGNALMITYSCPLFDVTKNDPTAVPRGIVTVDVRLEDITEFLSKLRLQETGYAFLMNSEGVLLAHPEKGMVMNESIYTLSGKANDRKLKALAKQISEKQNGFIDIGTTALSKKDSYLAFSKLPRTDWTLGIVFPKDELFEEVTALHKRIAILALVGALLLLIMSYLVARSIAKPLRIMAAETKKIAEGNLDINLSSVKSSDEVGRLGLAFERMASDLRNYIDQLTEATAARERIESELSIAAGIQRDMLPSRFPPFPDRPQFDIYALMRPAKQVGGDFYDFLMLGDDQVCVVVGDVSGKGVPAALLMAVTKYLVEAFVTNISNPGEILKRVNQQIVRNNESCMFVTMVIGILDLHGGEFRYAGGGHDPLILLSPDGETRFLPNPGGPVLGIMEDAEFAVSKIVLEPGSTICAYTDGITEAFNEADAPFTDERLLKTAAEFKTSRPKGLAESIVSAVDQFSEGIPQSDDITVLTLQFNFRQKST